jgi:hypothetical protein
MTKNRLLAVFLALVLVFAPLSGVFAAEGQHIRLTSAVPSSASVTAGVLYKLALPQCFNDTNGHTLSYSWSGSNLNQYIHIGPDSTNSNIQTFFFTAQYPGNYSVTISASCGGDSASFILPIEVTPANPGSAAQYDYAETPASAVTVYVTVSNDGMPLMGNDDASTKLACLAVTLPYFDLATYGLEDYYRYDTYDNLVERPTMLHLYIYLLERYYMGLDEEDCLTGESGVIDNDDYTDVYYMDGTSAYDNGSYYSAMSISGSPQSLYFTNFWGHNENLMYFRNHMFPLMTAGWGATADYILLSDGDYIDVAMFSDWNFRFDGAFVSFAAPTFVTTTNMPLSFETKQFDTMGYTNSLTDMNDPLTFYVYSVSGATWTPVSNPSITHTPNSNDYEIALTTAGTYYIVATEPGAPDDYACLAPAAMKVIVSAP